MPPITWDVIVDSSLERIKKPDPRLFKIAEERAGVPGAEILFIDNMDRNTEPAKAFGWQTFLYDPTDHEAACRDLSKFLQAKSLLQKSSK
jgi:putative hydrolase of the HAD superfamily